MTSIYYGLAWFSLVLSVFLLAVGLFNATLLPSEKGFYGILFLMALFGDVVVQKIRVIWRLPNVMSLSMKCLWNRMKTHSDLLC
ncbi:hypothetical protein GCM10009007_07330 [Formosimonas limnophila]|uniref:YiaAB two helix domain-containing protein n=1 Tax=Formosimonas limnophila TaxID=1384487 RepID=A0A8J3FZJ5_9BURK|nr:hypothetical protein GCM10009007_07330 [Formosimonas limnophila]